MKTDQEGAYANVGSQLQTQRHCELVLLYWAARHQGKEEYKNVAGDL
jgi:hypothetical protein